MQCFFDNCIDILRSEVEIEIEDRVAFYCKDCPLRAGSSCSHGMPLGSYMAHIGHSFIACRNTINIHILSLIAQAECGQRMLNNNLQYCNGCLMAMTNTDRVLRVVYDQSVMHAVLDQIWSKYSSRYNWTTPEQYNLTAGQALPDPPAIHCAIVIKGDINYTLLALL